MTVRNGPIFESTILDKSGSDELADWLRDYAEQSGSDAGVTDAQVFSSATEQGPAFVLQLVFSGDEALDEFLAGQASTLESEIERISEGSAIQGSRVLKEDRTQNLPGDSDCLNCGMPLRGQYCGQCGQRARSRLISLWELISDAFGDLFELDSRLWQTLVPLLIRPGQLTADYLRGKRARFMPPFRSYLVLSLLFFVVAFFDPREDLAILFAEEPVAESDEQAGVDVPASESDGNSGAAADVRGPGFAININEEDVESGCNVDDEDISDLPRWLQRRLTKERLTHICEQASADDGKQLVENMLDNIPAALIVLLPFMALVLKLLYPLSRRYYVEHLLFFVHFHAFFFLILSLQILWERFISAIGLNEAIAVIPIVVTSLYIPIYLFRAMRRVYQQRFFLTLLKYVALVVVYALGFGATMMGALAIAAFSI